jgi:hypothetical protein
MIRPLLTDRFKLKTHIEARPVTFTRWSLHAATADWATAATCVAGVR